MAAGAAEFTDFVDMNKDAMATALAALSLATTDMLVTVEQGNTVSFGYKTANS